MNNIKFIEFIISNTILTGNRYIKLSNNLFISKGGYCLKLLKLNKKKTQFKLLDNSPQMMWSVLIAFELKDKNIIVGGKKQIMILKIVNRSFELVQTINGEWGELLDLIQVENEKIIISSVDFLLILGKINNEYQIINKIDNISRWYNEIKYLSENKFLLGEFLNQTKLTVFDLTTDVRNKRKLKCCYNFVKESFNKKLIFNLHNKYIAIQSKKTIYILDIKIEEFIFAIELENNIVDCHHFQDDYYLFAFENKEIGLISLKNEFIIEETKEIKNPFHFINIDKNEFIIFCLE